MVAQPVAEVVAKSGFQELSGIQRKLLEIVYMSCRKNGDKISAPITISYLSILLKTSSGTVKNGIHRLQKKELLHKENFKNGRGGWTQYRLHEDTYQDLLQYESDSKLVAQPVAQLVASLSSSSSVQKNKSTTTSDELWKTLDLSSVEKMGINQSAIFEARQKFGPFDFIEFETFLERFSKYMSDSSKSRGIGNARGFFFSLCKQIGEGIEPLSEVQTASDEALENLLKTRKEQKRKREEMERELMIFEFDEWFEQLSTLERDEISPSSDLLKPGTEPYRAVFRGYFEKNLWPRLRETMVK